MVGGRKPCAPTLFIVHKNGFDINILENQKTSLPIARREVWVSLHCLRHNTPRRAGFRHGHFLAAVFHACIEQYEA